MDIHLTNTLTKEKEIFKPIDPGKVGMYHCGPTVYWFIHIGNLRAFILADITRRVFEYAGYEVKQVMNVTDVGHLVSDGDEGEDKMTKGLKREGLSVTLENMLVLARRYEDAFLSDMDNLNIKRPLIVRASEHIKEDIIIIEKLEEKGFCYATSDGVYFDTSKMPDYGKLGGLDLYHEGESRIGEQTEKKSARDFALWKFDQNMGWESPWGRGFPGWHIECSGMSMKYLGEHFDIHTGGHDLATVHHNNEIAQSECSTGHTFVNYWLHNEFVNVEGAKMAKSGDNFITLRTIIDKGFHPLSLRYLYLQAHYRSQVSFSWESLQAAETALLRLSKQLQEIEHEGVIHEGYNQKFKQAIFDDLNTGGGLAVVWELLKDDSVSPADKKATILQFDEVLGFDLKNFKKEAEAIEIPEEVNELLAARQEARNQKDWHKADQIRLEIESFGLTVKDTPEGQKLEKK